MIRDVKLLVIVRAIEKTDDEIAEEIIESRPDIYSVKIIRDDEKYIATDEPYIPSFRRTGFASFPINKSDTEPPTPQPKKKIHIPSDDPDNNCPLCALLFMKGEMY